MACVCIRANGQVRFRQQTGRSMWCKCSWRRGWTQAHQDWAEGPGRAPTGSRVFTWGTDGVRVGIGLETLGSAKGLGR